MNTLNSIGRRPVSLKCYEAVQKGNKKKSETKAEIESINDYYSKKALKRDLDMVATYDRHNIYDALGLGIYAAEVDLGKRPMPRLFRCSTSA